MNISLSSSPQCPGSYSEENSTYGSLPLFDGPEVWGKTKLRCSHLLTFWGCWFLKHYPAYFLAIGLILILLYYSYSYYIFFYNFLFLTWKIYWHESTLIYFILFNWCILFYRICVIRFIRQIGWKDKLAENSRST